MDENPAEMDENPSGFKKRNAVIYSDSEDDVSGSEDDVSGWDKMDIQMQKQSTPSSKHANTRVNPAPPRKRILTPPKDSDDSDDENPRRSARRKLSFEKEERIKRIAEYASRRRNKNRNGVNYDENDNNDKSVSNSEVDDNDNVSSDENTPQFDVKTRIFKSKYSGCCSFPMCGKKFKIGVSRIMGVHLYNQETDKFESDWNGKPFWICAIHGDDQSSTSGSEESSEYNSENGDEWNDSDKDFIDDEGEVEFDEDEMNNITKKLSKCTSEDDERKRKYMDEHALYQLQIHKDTNPGLHLSPEKRLRRNIKTAKNDIGLKQDLLHGPEDMVPVTAFLDNNKKVRIFPQTKTIATFGVCALKSCKFQFEANHTQIIKIESKKKNHDRWICFDHVNEEYEKDSSDSD